MGIDRSQPNPIHTLHRRRRQWSWPRHHHTSPAITSVPRRTLLVRRGHGNNGACTLAEADEGRGSPEPMLQGGGRGGDGATKGRPKRRPERLLDPAAITSCGGPLESAISISAPRRTTPEGWRRSPGAGHKPGVEPHAHRPCTFSSGKAIPRGVVITTGGASCVAVVASMGVLIATRASYSESRIAHSKGRPRPGLLPSWVGEGSRATHKESPRVGQCATPWVAMVVGRCQPTGAGASAARVRASPGPSAGQGLPSAPTPGTL